MRVQRRLKHPSRRRCAAPQDEGCRYGPSALDELLLVVVEMAEIGGLCPNAMFSALAPRTRIPPHHGETNARVVVHLPLIVPPGCRYRVGFDECDWQVGRILAFDDTLAHSPRTFFHKPPIDVTFVTAPPQPWQTSCRSSALTSAERSAVS